MQFQRYPRPFVLAVFAAALFSGPLAMPAQLSQYAASQHGPIVLDPNADDVLQALDTIAQNAVTA